MIGPLSLADSNGLFCGRRSYQLSSEGSMSDYLWPDPQAVKHISGLLGLELRGYEQDWDLEFGRRDVVGPALTLFTNAKLELEDRSALMLLVLAGVQDASDQDMIDEGQIRLVREVLESDTVLKSRMISYWYRTRFLEEFPKSPLHCLLSKGTQIEQDAVEAHP
ncbi:MAG TPA: hypothetical protein VEX38_04220 [Fimbriimonadaceae bacterium]|nr:hypothetical protein [Fimbriimonadaceae bacterium]